MNRPLRNAADLDGAEAAGQATLYPDRLKILIGSASCGVAVGARAIEAAAVQAVTADHAPGPEVIPFIREHDLEVVVSLEPVEVLQEVVGGVAGARGFQVHDHMNA